MEMKIRDGRRLVALVLVAVFLVVVAIKGISDFVMNSGSDDVEPLTSQINGSRGGSVDRLLRSHSDRRISGDLYRAWERGDVWVVMQDMPSLEDLRLEQLTAEAAYQKYGKRANSGAQTVFILNAEKVKAARTDAAAADELEEVLLLAYEHWMRQEQEPDTAAQ